jgi:hypothetical protein
VDIDPPLYIDEPLAVDAISNLVFARPTDNVSVWPSIYEKAYAVYRGQDPAKPDITQLSSGNPVPAMCDIQGLPCDSKLLKSSTYYSEKKFNLQKLFTDINARCGRNTSIGGRTQKPMVTWTYYDSTLTPFQDTFTDDLIVANHSYSILGTTVTREWGNCVVLRNPYGFSVVTQPKPGIHDCKPWNGAYAFSMAQGNFAVEMDAFTRYFEGYGFVI